jgi:membrane protease subunit HflK
VIWRVGVAICLLIWIVTGTFVVRGDQQAVVRRFGRFVTDESGEPKLFGSGLHWELPYPFSQVDRIKLNEARSLALAAPPIEVDQLDDILMAADSSLESQFLTGDKNVLHLEMLVHYRISKQNLRQFLTSSESPELRLRALVESIAADLISRSGVDFVHPLGLGELQLRMTQAVREPAARMGLEIDVVSIDQVTPPIRVKSEFLDVANARADKDRYIQTARSYAEQKAATANAAASQLLDKSESQRRALIESARGQAATVTRMLDQIAAADQPVVARKLTMRRLYVEAMEDVLQSVAGKVFLESGEPVDLMLFQEPSGQP